MTDMGDILVIIPARGGSRRLPRKNILPLAGKPLICWTIEAALETRMNAQIVVTSEDEEILEIAGQYEQKGVTIYKRPADLATDSASTLEVIADVCLSLSCGGNEPQTIVILQPTSPLRSAEDIRNATNLYYTTKNTGVSVCEVQHPSAWVGTLTDDGIVEGIDFFGRKVSNAKREYRLNGAVYVCHRSQILQHGSIYSLNTRAFVMPLERSIDIDTETDFVFAECMIKSNVVLV